MDATWQPDAYRSQITRQQRTGYWWDVYGRRIWNQLPMLEAVLRRNPAYNKPSITVRDSDTHLDGTNTPCLMYLTFSIRNAILEVGVHYDTNAIEYLQANLYGLTEVQRIVADDLHLTVGTYHQFIDSLYVYRKHYAALKGTSLTSVT